METVYIRRFSQQEETRENILPATTFTALFPADHGLGDYSDAEWAYAGADGRPRRTGQSSRDSPTPG